MARSSSRPGRASTARPGAIWTPSSSRRRTEAGGGAAGPAPRDKAEETVTRIPAGLNTAEVRGVLRNDPPGRPNPRLKPHDEGFWLHMKPTYYHNLVDGLYPTFRLGWLSTLFFAFEILTGVFLMFYYTPSPP